MGWPCAEIKGNATMIAEFFCRLLGLIGGCRHFVKPMALASMMALMPVSSVMASDQPVLMVLGDSLVAGHGLPQGEAFPDELGRLLKKDGVDVEIVNAGVSGDTTAGGLARLDWSLAAKPDAAMIVLGGNDLLRGLEPAASYRNLEGIIEQLAANQVEVLLAGMQAPRNLGADYANEFDAIYDRLAKRHKILFYPFFLDGVALQSAMNQPDGMHPNEQGVAHIATKILPLVKTLLSKTGKP
jgi:acyl-CoA thioesterase-1